MLYKAIIKHYPVHTRICVAPASGYPEQSLVIKLNEGEYQALKAAIRAEIEAEIRQKDADQQRNNFLIMRGE